MGYSVLRIQKIKTKAEMRQSYAHQYRFSDPKNADKNFEGMNEVAVESASFDEAWDERMEEIGAPTQQRRNRVLAYDMLLSYSPSSSGSFDVDDWKMENEKWLQDMFGEDNVLSVVYHNDEASAIETGTVHGHAFVVPVDSRGHLNSSYYTGTKTQLRHMQDSYGMAMEKFGLERGVEGSRAYHEERRHFYARLEKARNMKMPEQEPGEKDADYTVRLKDAFQQERREHVAKNRDLERKIRSLQMMKSQCPEKEAEYDRLLSSLKEEQKKEQELVREFGSRRKMNEMASGMQDLNDAVKNEKDKGLASRTAAETARLAGWAEEERIKKEKKRQQEKAQR